MDLFFVYFFSHFLSPYFILFLPSSSSTLFHLLNSSFLSVELVEAKTFVICILEAWTWAVFPQALRVNDEILGHPFHSIPLDAI